MHLPDFFRTPIQLFYLLLEMCSCDGKRKTSLAIPAIPLQKVIPAKMISFLKKTGSLPLLSEDLSHSVHERFHRGRVWSFLFVFGYVCAVSFRMVIKREYSYS